MSSSRLVPAEVIAVKRDGGELAPDQLRDFLAGYLAGTVAEEQMSALLMAGVINGFSDDEAVVMTDALVNSGDVVDLSGLRGPTVDKHSTGGVGDTCTLVVAPILAACGAQVAKLSGRGLGHTGGTLDKLESIPGFTISLSPEAMQQQVERVGVAVAAATADLVPLDKRLYALRDVTGTVPSPALIAASVMSKKIAGGARHVLLDVKTGDGAFMEDPADALALAQLCVRIGQAHGRRPGALVTDMSQPLSHAVGNAIEVAHAVDVLADRRQGRFRDLCIELAAGALELTGRDHDTAMTDALDAVTSGRAAEVFTDMVAAQGGDANVVADPLAVLPAAPVQHTCLAPVAESMVVSGVECRAVGELVSALGAGRTRKEDDVDPAVGLELLVEVGQRVAPDEPIAVIHARTHDTADWAAQRLAELVSFDTEAEVPPLVHARVALGWS